MCIFESDTVKSDCSMPENYELFKDLIQTVGLLYLSITVCSGVIKKKSSENDQSTGHFQSFFSSFFSIYLSKKKSRKSANKKILALFIWVYNLKSYFTAPQALP